jgi:hypothetical protein
MATQTTLGIFNAKLIAFFEDLYQTFPEERDIKLAVEGLNGIKKVNPRLILDMFTEYVSKPLKEDILAENEEKVIAFAKMAVSTQFNEVSPALLIFDKYWPTLSDSSRVAIWKHLKVLVLLADRAVA